MLPRCSDSDLKQLQRAKGVASEQFDERPVRLARLGHPPARLLGGLLHIYPALRKVIATRGNTAVGLGLSGVELGRLLLNLDPQRGHKHAGCRLLLARPGTELRVPLVGFVKDPLLGPSHGPVEDADFAALPGSRAQDADLALELFHGLHFEPGQVGVGATRGEVVAMDN